MSRLWIVLLLMAFAGIGCAAAAQAGGVNKLSRGAQESLPLPRFVSLKSDKVYMRRGPGIDNPIIWTYRRRHMPMEIVAEYDIWRKVRDVDGTQGWISMAMLSGERYVVVLAGKNDKDRRWPLYRRPSQTSDVIALAEPGAIAALKRCPAAWCEIAAQGHTGWIARAALWGVLPGEQIE